MACRSTIGIDAEGRLTACTLAAPHTFGPWALPEGTMLGFEVGVLRSAEINSKTKLGDREVAEGNTVYFERGPDEISSVQETVYGD